MRSKMVALLLILLVGNFMLAQTTPAPTPKPDDSKAMCACCQGDKTMKAGDKCPMMSGDKAKGNDKCPMMSGDKAKGNDKCPMMSGDKAKGNDKCPMMSAEQAKKGCCAGDKCKAEKMHEHAGN
jgi:hypothetical protein